MLRLNRLAFLLPACCFYLFGTAQTTSCAADFSYSIGNNRLVNFVVKDSLGATHRWLFGDGSPALITANGIITHQYARSGRYEVKHFVEKPGCGDSATKIIAVESTDTCSAAFTYQKTPAAMSYRFFNNSMPAAGIKESAWTFGDGSSSHDFNAAHSYTKPGTYTVCLQIATSNGCKNEYCAQLQVIDSSNICNISAGYQYYKDTLDCKKIYFKNTSDLVSTNMHFNWKFGDGTESKETSPVHLYTRPGKYYVCLVTEAGSNCRKEYCDSVTVNCDIPCNISSRFEWRKDSADCKKIRFINLSGNVTSSAHFAWKFGDGNGSYDASPSHVYAQPGRYQVCLVVDAGNNCNNYYCDSITVFCGDSCMVKPAFNWKADETSLNKIHFTNATVSPAAAIHYTWNFGDNSSSNDISPVHMYNQPGTYKVCLVAEISNVCHREICQEIEIKKCSVSARFEQRRDASKWTTVYFNNVSGPVNNIWQTYWSYGDSVSSRDYNSIHSYEKPGSYQVCLKVIGLDGCTGQYCDTVRIIKPDSCDSKAAFWHDSSSTNSIASFAALYSNNKAGYYWSFGDGMTSQGKNTSHAYSKPGKYKVCLTVKDDQCSVMHCEEIVVQPANASGRIMVYPNPAVNTVSLDLVLNNTGPVSIRLLDGNGAVKAVYSKTGSAGNNRFTLPVEKLSQGIYLVEIKTSHSVWFSRFMKG